MKHKKTLLSTLVVLAGTFTLYSQSGETFYSLDDLYNRLESGEQGSRQEFTDPASGPATPVGRSVNEIMEKAPAVHGNAATAAQVLQGRYFWSLDGSGWGQQQGTMVNVGGQNVTPGTAEQTITRGYHDGTGSVAGDADLTPENIRSGVGIFGVTGTAPVPSGDATAEMVLDGATFSNDTETGVAGTMVNVGQQTITPGTTAQPITQGYHDGTGSVAGDADLRAENIKAGISIFGVSGDPAVVNTSSGTATSDHILAGEKAWVNGEEVTGTVPVGESVTGNNGELEIAIPDGLYSGGDNTATAVDANLVTGNIKAGISIFGVSGDPAVVNTSSGTATANTIVAGEKAWVDGQEVEGTLPAKMAGEWIVVYDRILIDPDKNVYTTVQIGTQVWTVENLRTTKYADGTAIPHVTDNREWGVLSSPAYSWYNNDPGQGYGALYNWWVVDTLNEHKIAPEGWKVPTDADWTELENYLIANGYNWDGSIPEGDPPFDWSHNKIGKAMASSGGEWGTSATVGHVGNDQESNNSSGFSALPGGYRFSYGNFDDVGSSGRWWSATESNASFAWDRYLNRDTEYLDGNYRYKGLGLSVRLLRD